MLYKKKLTDIGHIIYIGTSDYCQWMDALSMHFKNSSIYEYAQISWSSAEEIPPKLINMLCIVLSINKKFNIW